jgi:hypothetical protein
VIPIGVTRDFAFRIDVEIEVIPTRTVGRLAIDIDDLGHGSVDPIAPVQDALVLLDPEDRVHGHDQLL